MTLALPPVGIGTWHMGESRARAAAEVAAIRAFVDAAQAQGAPALIDTAEMYGDGGAERIVAEAIRGRRDACLLVSKVLPHRATRRGTVAACEASLKRLGTDRLDLYLLHWRANVPLAETVDALRGLVAAGKVLRWGVSNFDVDDLEALLALAPGAECAVNQVYWSLSERSIETGLKALQDRHGMATMAYCPLDGGALVSDRRLVDLAAALGLDASQVALAWLAGQPATAAIPMTRSTVRAVANLAAGRLSLPAATRSALDQCFPVPDRRMPLRVV